MPYSWPAGIELRKIIFARDRFYDLIPAQDETDGGSVRTQPPKGIIPPESRFIGATPTSFAICARLSLPSSGRNAKIHEPAWKYVQNVPRSVTELIRTFRLGGDIGIYYEYDFEELHTGDQREVPSFFN